MKPSMKALCVVLLSTLLCVGAAALPATHDGSGVTLAPDTLSTALPANETEGTAPGELGLTPDFKQNGTLEIVANKSVSLEDGFDGEDEKDVEGEDTNNDEGDQIYSENENYLDNYDENNDEQDEENGDADEEDDSGCN